MKSFKRINKSFFIVFIALILFVFFSIKSYAEMVSSDLESSVFRLHVIANSDSEEDQKLKYKVRDSLINYMNELTYDSASKEETISIAHSHLPDFKAIAEKTIVENGFDYNVNVEIGNFNFPTKNYGDIKFPAGNYDALRVKIGEASGQNWWCVMFPPLCFVDVTSASVPDDSKETLKESLSEEEYELISQSDETSELKFKVIEVFNSLAAKISH